MYDLCVEGILQKTWRTVFRTKRRHNSVLVTVVELLKNRTSILYKLDKKYILVNNNNKTVDKQLNDLPFLLLHSIIR